MKNINIVIFYFFLLSWFALAPNVFSQKPQLIIPTGHTSTVMSSIFSPDEKYILTTGVDGIAKLWEAKSGKELIAYIGHGSGISSCAFSKNGKKIITGSWDNKVKLWETETGKCLQTYQGATNWITAVAFSSDNENIIASSEDGFIRIWSTSTNKLIRSFNCKSGRIRCMDISKDGRYIATAHDDKTIKIWSFEKGKKIKTFKGHTASINSISFNQQGNQLISVGKDFKTCIWDCKIEKIVYVISGNNTPFTKAIFCKDDKQVITADKNGSICLWDVNKNTPIITIKAHQGEVSYLCLNAANTLLLSAGSDQKAKQWDIATGKIYNILEGHAFGITALTYSNDGTSLLSGNNQGSIKIANLVTGKSIINIETHAEYTTDIGVSKNSNCFFSAGNDSLITMYDAQTLKEIRHFKGHKGTVSKLNISPDGKHIASASSDKSVKIWNIETGTEQFTLNGHEAKVSCVSYNNSGDYLISGGWDGTLNIWKANNGELFRKIKIENEFISNAIYSPDNSFILVTTALGKIYMYNKTGDSLLRKISAHEGLVIAAAFSPDGKQFATAGMDKKIKLWQSANCSETSVLLGHSGWINALCFDPNGKKIASSSMDGTIKIWDLEKKSEINTLVFLNKTDWVSTNAGGLFDASANAMKQLYYTIGLEPVELEQLKERYYEPGLLQKSLGYNEEKTRNVENFENAELYPDVKLTTKNNSEKYIVALKNRGGGIGKVSVFINGKEVNSDIRGTQPDPLALEMNLELDISNHPFIIPGQKNTIEIKAANKDGYLVSRGIEMILDVPPVTKFEIPTLYIVSIGTSDYIGKKIDLKYAAKDATDISKALEIGAKRLFGETNTIKYLLTTDQKEATLQPTRNNILSTFETIGKTSKSTDIIVIYLSGHGINFGGQDGDFYYLTKDAFAATPDAYGDPAIRSTCTISSAELTNAIKKIAALKQVLIIDACSSGKMVDNLIGKRDISSSTVRALDRLKDRTGMHIITGCAADAVSYEATKYGQGLLTYSILEGIKGTALREEKFIDVAMLLQKSRERVPELAAGLGGIQKPEVFSPNGSQSFDIGILTTEDKSTIPLAQAKPMFLMSSLQDEETFDDILGIEKLVDENFRNITAKSVNSKIIFIEAKEYPEAYRIRGQYKTEENSILLKANIFKGKEKVSSMVLNEKKENLQQLADAIIKKAEEVVK